MEKNTDDVRQEAAALNDQVIDRELNGSLGSPLILLFGKRKGGIIYTRMKGLLVSIRKTLELFALLVSIMEEFSNY